MNTRTIKNNKKRQRRKWRVRSKLNGTATRPRLSVFKSNRHLSVQLIDDENHATLGSASTVEKNFRAENGASKSKESAKKIGEAIAAIAKKMQIDTVVFDRGPYKYHGLLAELADAARGAGLKF